jgi:NADH dehydrogenase FAD-containing subunit
MPVSQCCEDLTCARQVYLICFSLNIGSTPNTSSVPGTHEHAIPVKPIDGFLRRLNELKTRIVARQGRARVAVVGGGGAAGAELTLSVASRMRQEVARAQCLRVSVTTQDCRHP